VAFFDLDHTILNDSSGKILGIQAFINNIFKKRYMFEAAFISAAYKFNLMDPEKILIKMGKWLRGQQEEKIVDFMNTMFNKVMKQAIRQKAHKEIEYHKKNNALTVILSASTSQICEPVKNHLGFDDMICTILEVINGRFTGYPKGRYCYGEEKLVRSINYCKKYNLTLENAWFYTDSYSDIPMLNAVGHPVCVSPDNKLRRFAQSKGWDIERW